MRVQKDSMEAYHRAAQNHEHIQSIEYLRGQGLQLKHLAVMRDVDRQSLRLGGLFAYPRKTIVEETAQRETAVKALTTRGAGYLAATKFAQLYMAADYEAGESLHVSTIAFAAAWADFKFGWPPEFMGSKCITIRDAYQIAVHLLTGELLLRHCPSCSSPLLGAGRPLCDGTPLDVLSECIQCHLMRTQRRGKSS